MVLHQIRGPAQAQGMECKPERPSVASCAQFCAAALASRNHAQVAWFEQSKQAITEIAKANKN
jgi:hypothetical protein